MKLITFIMKLLIAFILCFSIICSKETKLKKIQSDILPANGSKSFKPIRINFVHLNSEIKSDYTSPFSNEKYEKFKKTIINVVDKYFKSFLKVYPLPAQNPKPFKLTTTDENLTFNIPDISEHLNGYDFVFYLLFAPLGSTTNASAITKDSYLIGNTYRRPTIGLINVNTDKFLNFESIKETDIIELRRTFYHEMTHALAFSKNLYKDYIDSSGKALPLEAVVKDLQYPNSGGRTYKVIVHEKMLKAIREYFACPTARGFPLDLKGNAHFLQQLVADTFMRPIPEDFDYRISRFMLTLFDITGWYIVDYSKEEKTLYGKGKGCDYIELSCKDTATGKLFDEYCPDSNNYLDCDFYSNSVSKCTKEDPNGTIKPKENYGNTCEYRRPFYGHKCSSKQLNWKCVRFSTNSGFSAECTHGVCNESEKSITITVERKAYKSVYENDKPKTKGFTVKTKEYLFPESFERFCFYQLNPQPKEKQFRFENKKK